MIPLHTKFQASYLPQCTSYRHKTES